MLALVEFLYMVGIDLLFLAVLFLVMLPLGMYRQAAFAVMKRNFSGYFSNPTGYVFLCLFVALTSFAAFWPHEFFTTNLANFGQLNRFLPYIMLVFIPAITMSIWAEERRQGTDELLLTLPAHDFDIVIGKYFAAVLIFTVSLIFSQLSNYAVLLALTGGELDTGLLFSTYLGYWFIGLAMLAIGMVASFLTNNLTVGFIFGAAFNAPLVFFSNADVIVSNRSFVHGLEEFSLLQRFEPFGRGLIASPSIIYFLGIMVLGVYLSLILIGRRHWLGGRDGTSMLGHYVVRAFFLVVALLAVVVIVQYSPLNRLRIDVSREKVSTLSPSTRTILERLRGESDAEPIVIDAYVGAAIPTEFVRTRYDLVNLLREFDVLGGNRIQVHLNTGLEPFSQEAIGAEKRFGIRAVPVVSESRGARREEQVILGAAFSSGRQRDVIRFFAEGTPVEYELIRAVDSVARTKKKTLGVVQTDLFPLGQMIRQEGQIMQIPQLAVLGELAKQYNLELVQASTKIPLWVEDDAGKPIARKYDVLLAIQPSKMAPLELDNLIEAIQSGQPTAIFEDPLVYNVRSQDPTAVFQGQPTPLGTMFPRQINRVAAEGAYIEKLWEVLGIDVTVEKRRVQGESQKFPWVIWKTANPYQKSRALDVRELFIVRDDSAQVDWIDGDDPATRGIEELYFPYPGQVAQKAGGGTQFIPLVSSGPAGKISILDLMTARDQNQLEAAEGLADSEYVFAARVTGGGVGGELRPGEESPINVVYVADIDFLGDSVYLLWNNPSLGGNIEYRFDNVAFFNNIVDSLAGESDFLLTRSRRIRHSTLRYVEATTEEALDEVFRNEQEFEKQFNNAVLELNQEVQQAVEPLRQSIAELQQRQAAGEAIDQASLDAKVKLLQQTEQEQMAKQQRQQEEFSNELNEKKRAIRLDAELEIQKIQRGFKLAAVVLPVIPPLLLGLMVFARRRLREREGIAKARRLK